MILYNIPTSYINIKQTERYFHVTVTVSSYANDMMQFVEIERTDKGVVIIIRYVVFEFSGRFSCSYMMINFVIS